MKKIFFLVVFTLLSTGLSKISLIAQNNTQTPQKNQGIQFFNGTWEEVKAEARKLGKPIFVDAYTTWCGPCKMMAANTFPDPQVGSFYNKFYVNYKIDAEKGEGRDFARTYRVDRYPTLLFINGDGDLLYRSLGYQQPSQFIMEGRKGLYDEKAMLAHQQEYQNGKREAPFMRNYIMMLWAGNLPEYDNISNEFIAGLNQQDLSDTENLQFVFDLANTMDSKAFNLLTSNQSLFVKALGDEVVSDKINGVAFMSLKSAITKHDNQLFDKILSTIKQSGSSKSGEYIELASLEYFQGTKNWKQYISTASNFLDDFKTKDPNTLNNIAWEFFLHADKKKDLKKASKWAEQSVKLEPAYYNWDTYASLLYKLDKKKDALKAANQAIELAIKSKQDYSSTQKLVDRINNSK
ncbi:MAG: thioredoxin family protein [Sphingobacteriales bacterium]|nr:MAG: thioredoxin family protein [Sphingobacteriales bacterium]